MPTKTSHFAVSSLYALLVWGISSCIFGLLAWQTYYINFWPSDPHWVFLNASKVFSQVHSVSLLHKVLDPFGKGYVLYGKEVMVLGVHLFQKLFHDQTSLYPIVFLLILAVTLSQIFIYYLFRSLFSPFLGFAAFLLFTFSCWPYIYILSGAHPPLALAFFLLACVLILPKEPHLFLFFFSGLALACVPFSSPTGVLYCPFYAALFFYLHFKQKWRFDAASLTAFLGFLVGLSFFILPDPAETFKGFILYARLNDTFNNFFVLKPKIAGLFSVFPPPRMGLVWVQRYFLLLQPLLWGGFLLSSILVLPKAVKRPVLWTPLLLSWLPLMAIEAKQVTQFGRTYFPCLAGFLFLIAWTLFLYRKVWEGKYRKYFLSCLTLFLTAHIALNVYIFKTDVWDSRMFSNKIYQWLIKHHIHEIYIAENMPYYKNIVAYFNNPKYRKKIVFKKIRSLEEAKGHYVLLAPSTGKSIWDNCSADDLGPAFPGETKGRVVASFKSLASSRIWPQEEEVCTYRDLILHQITGADRAKGYIRILKI